MQINRISAYQNFGMPIIQKDNSCDLKQEIVDLVKDPNAGISDFQKKELLEAGRKLNRLSGYHNVIGTLGDATFPAYICFEPKTQEALAARMSLGKDIFSDKNDIYIDAYTHGVPLCTSEKLSCDPVKFINVALKILPTLEPRITANSQKEKIYEHFDK